MKSKLCWKLVHHWYPRSRYATSELSSIIDRCHVLIERCLGTMALSLFRDYISWRWVEYIWQLSYIAGVSIRPRRSSLQYSITQKLSFGIQILQYAWHTSKRIPQGKAPPASHFQTPHVTLTPGSARTHRLHPPISQALSKRVPYRHPRHCNQLLRSPPNPRQIPTSTPSPLDIRLRVLRRHSFHTFRQCCLQIQGRR